MSHQIAIFFAAAAIGISCIATDAPARGGGGGSHGGGGPMVAVSGKTYNSMNTSALPRAYSVNRKAGKIRRADGAGGPNAGSPGASAGMGAGYYAPASYTANIACGRYPYPPCKKVLAH